MAKEPKPKESKPKSTKSNSNKTTGRPKPMTPKAGFTKNKRRYGCGGKLSK